MDPTCSPFPPFKYPSPSTSVPPFSPSFLPSSPVHTLQFIQVMLFHSVEAVQLPMLSESEIQELFSFINQQSGVDPAASPSSGSQGSNRAVYSAEERKVRRMQSNRESARRSRCRKKKHLENLTSQLNRLRIENRELKNRLAFTKNHHLLLSIQNDELISDSATLLATLSDLYEILDYNLLSQ